MSRAIERRSLGRLALAVAAGVLVACRADVVEPGFYGFPDAGPARTITQMENAVNGSAAGIGAAAGSGGLAGVGAIDQAGTGAAGTDVGSAGVNAAGSGGGEPAACDLRGRWLLTHHVVVDGLGQLQTTHTWKYLELDQQGEALTVTKGLHCGDDVVARTALGANGDMHAMWPAAVSKISYAGLHGTSRATASGCEVKIDRHYVAFGATLPFYNDPAHALPMLAEQASGSTPGWEDWEGDGNPGITVVVSGAATGRRFMASRSWHELSGSVPDGSDLFTLVDTWNQENVVLGVDGSPLLTQDGVRAADATLHFVEMARLGDGDALGDDATICAAVRMLAKTLTPTAAGL